MMSEEIPEIDNELYKPYVGHTRPTKIVAAAILVDGYLWTGERHFELIQKAAEKDGVPIPIKQDQQGFWTDDGRFVSRSTALKIALLHGQVKEEDLITKGKLLSEDLW